jgi:hypothetical protein
VADKPKASYGPVGSIAKFAIGNVAKVFGYALYPLKKGVGAIRR